MKIAMTALQGVQEPRGFGDARGLLGERWTPAERGIDVAMVQVSDLFNAPVGTRRELHYRGPPNGQTKVVRCAAGATRDAVTVVTAQAGLPRGAASGTHHLARGPDAIRAGSARRLVAPT